MRTLVRNILPTSERRTAGWSLALLLLVLTTAPGCTFWRNFSTYFNTIYLAQAHLDAYEESQRVPQSFANPGVAVQNHRWLDEEYLTRELALREGRRVSVTPGFSRTLSATKQVNSVHLDSAIILGSKVLASKKETKYVEEALFIVGKAQYLKNDFAGSRRKFLELLYRFPDTKYGAEVQVLLSRSMLANRQLDTAQAALTRAISMGEKQGDKSVLSEVHRTYAEYLYARNPDSLAAIGEQLRLAEEGLSGNELSKLAMEEGAIYYFSSNWQEAERAFRVASTAAKDEWQMGEARISLALALRRQGKFEEARTELRDVAERAKFANAQPAARYELAYTNDLAARSAVNQNLRAPEFRTNYFQDLKTAYYSLDTAYKNSSSVIISRARFREAELFREIGEYDSAGKIAVSLIGTKDFSSNAMNELVNQRMGALSRFAQWRTDLIKIDTVESRMHAPKARTARDEEAATHMLALQEVLSSRYRPGAPVELLPDDTAKVAQAEVRLRKERASLPRLASTDTARFFDSLHYAASDDHFKLGRAYETFGEIPQARSEYRQALSYHFVIPDTAKDALHAQALYAWMQLESKEKNTTAADSLMHELLTYYGQTTYAQQARTLFAGNQSESRGEQAYTSAYGAMKEHGMPYALPFFLDIVLNYSKEDVAPRSLYAIGIFYEEHEKYDTAVSYYTRILKEYPYSIYAGELRPRLSTLAVNGPKQTARRVDPNDQKTNEQRQQEELDRQRKAQEEQLRREQQQSLPGLTPADPQSPGNSNPPAPPVPPPVQPTEQPPKTPSVSPSFQR